MGYAVSGLKNRFSGNAKKGSGSMPRVFLTFSLVCLVLGSVMLAGCPNKPTDIKPVPDFAVSAPKGTVPLTVQFTDRSKAGSTPIRAWTWEFGDGTGSSLPNPLKTYTTKGSFNVKLTVSSSQGNFTKVVENCVRVDEPTSFGSLGENGGVVSSLGVSIKVPAGVLLEETVFGVSESPGQIPMPSTENTVRASNTYTITHNSPSVDLFALDTQSRPVATEIRIPLLSTVFAQAADQNRQIFLLAKLVDGRILPVPARLEGQSVLAKVMRLPNRAEFVVAFRLESQTIRAREEATAKEGTEPVRQWADSWYVNAGTEMLRQMTALRLGDINTAYTFNNRSFPQDELNKSAGLAVAIIQALSDELAGAEIRKPALVEENDAYHAILFNMQQSYNPQYPSFSKLVYRDDFFGHLVVDPGQLLAISINNANTYAADRSNLDAAQVFDLSTALMEALFGSVIKGHYLPRITTTGDTFLGIPRPADRDDSGRVLPMNFLEGLEKGGLTYLGQSFANISVNEESGEVVMNGRLARSLEANQYALLSTPVFYPYDTRIQGYAQANQDFLFYMGNDPEVPIPPAGEDAKAAPPDLAVPEEDPEYEEPLALIAATLEGIRLAFDELAEEGETPTFLEALLGSYQVMNEVMDGNLPLYYWAYAKDLAFEGGDTARIRYADNDRAPYALDTAVFAESAVASTRLLSPSGMETLDGETYSGLDGILPLTSRAIIIETNPLTTELTIALNRGDWNVDADGNTLAVKVYKSGFDGIELSLPPGVYGDYELLDNDVDGLSDTVRVGNLLPLDEECGAQVVVLASNLSLEGLNSLAVTASGTALLNMPEERVLREYVEACDRDFSYSLRNSLSLPNYKITSYLLEMNSGVWRAPEEVDQPLWRHFITIIEPDVVTSKTAMLVISGGSTGSEPSGDLAGLVLPFATATSSVVAVLQAVPNQPLFFTDEVERERTEDEIIAYSYDKYLSSFNEGRPDKAWPSLLPMTRAAVRAMDSVQGFMGGKPSGVRNIEDFVVMGASKRGWTTWLTAAADSRVSAIVPMVIDVLSMEKQMEHHRRAYSSYPLNDTANKIVGGYSASVQDYVEMNVFSRFGTPASASLLKIVDPFTYRNLLTMPKLISNSTGDQFFLPDSSQFYLNRLPGVNYLNYAPNTDHSLTNSLQVDEGTLGSILAFYISHVRNTNSVSTDDVRVPVYTWANVDAADGSVARIRVTTPDQPKMVRLWQATNPNHRDFRLQTLGAGWTATRLETPCEAACESEDGCGCDEAETFVYTGEVDVPAPGTGWRAFMIQLTWPGPDPTRDDADYTFTTPVRVVPDVYPSN